LREAGGPKEKVGRFRLQPEHQPNGEKRSAPNADDAHPQAGHHFAAAVHAALFAAAGLGPVQKQARLREEVVAQLLDDGGGNRHEERADEKLGNKAVLPGYQHQRRAEKGRAK